MLRTQLEIHVLTQRIISNSNFLPTVFFTKLTMYFFADQGGDRVAWSKQWIASPDIWTYRANFDSRVRSFPRTVLFAFHLMILIL